MQATDAEFKSSVSTCEKNLGCTVESVERTWVDADGADTTTEADARGYKYLVKLYGCASNHLSSIGVFKQQASTPVNDPPIVSAFSFNDPVISTAGSEPLGGNFTLTVAREGDSSTTATTGAIGALSVHWHIKNMITGVAPEYQDNMICWEGSAYSNIVTDGREVFCWFRGYKKAVTMFTVDSTNLSGKSPLTVTVTREVSFGDALFLDPIPFEYLHQSTTTPHVMVTTRTVPAVCDGNCEYAYVAKTSKITDFTCTGSTLSITGESLPTSPLYTTLGYANYTCTSVTATSYSCSTTQNNLAGDWKPCIMEADGCVRLDTTATACSFVPTITEVFPAPVPQLGGGIMVITGTGFFQTEWQRKHANGEAASATLSVTIGGVASTVRSVTATRIECIIPDISSVSAANIDVVVTQNTKASAAKSVEKANTPNLVLSVDSLSASPVDKIVIGMTLDTGATTFTTNNNNVVGMLVNEEETYKLRVLEINADGSAKWKFPGAIKGTYNFYLADSSGNSLSSPRVFTSETTITSVSPTSGSVLGGTLITIVGTNFPTGAGDVIVRIGDNIGTIKTQEREKLEVYSPERGIADVVNDQGYFDTTNEKIIVILKGTEEATCTTSATCEFSFLTSETGTLTACTTAWATDKYEVTCTGTGFDTTVDNTRVLLGGIEHAATASTATEVKATITNLVTSNSFFASLYTSKGKMGAKSGLSVTPKFTQVSPNDGSEGGTLVTFTVVGVGTADAVSASVPGTIVSQSYNSITYRTNAGTAASAAVTLTVNAATVSCENTDTTLCNYQTTSAATPKVDSLTVSSGTLTLTGSDYPADYTISVELGKQVVTGTRGSATSVTATVQDGPGEVTPVVVFEKTTAPAHKHWAKVATTAKLDNAVTFGSTPSVTCSFAGGCNLDLAVAGLSTLVTNGEATVSVCGNSCAKTSASTDTTF